MAKLHLILVLLLTCMYLCAMAKSVGKETTEAPKPEAQAPKPDTEAASEEHDAEHDADHDDESDVVRTPDHEKCDKPKLRNSTSALNPSIFLKHGIMAFLLTVIFI